MEKVTAAAASARDAANAAGSHATTENLGFAPAVMGTVVAKGNPYRRVMHDTEIDFERGECAGPVGGPDPCLPSRSTPPHTEEPQPLCSPLTKGALRQHDAMIRRNVSRPPGPSRQHRRPSSLCDSTSSRRSAVSKIYAGPESLSELSPLEQPFRFHPQNDGWDGPALDDESRLADRHGHGHQFNLTGSATATPEQQFALKKKLALRRQKMAMRVLRTIGTVDGDGSRPPHVDSQRTRSERYCLTPADEADEYRCGQCERGYAECECGTEV